MEKEMSSIESQTSKRTFKSLTRSRRDATTLSFKGIPCDTELVLIRGLPGSGKSTMARTLVKLGYLHIEADMYMYNDGIYIYKADKVKESHEWCIEKLEMHC